MKSMKKRILFTVSILFYAGMLLLTLFARKLHDRTLPQVEVKTIEIGAFYGENGINSFGVSLPKKFYHDGIIYRISIEQINKELRTVARLVSDLEIGLENEICYEIKKGLSYDDKIIVSGLEGITDGCEVYIRGEE